MKVKVTETMCSELNKALGNMGTTSISEFQFVSLNPYQSFDNDETDLGFDYAGNWVRHAIKVVYKDECYAMPNYIATSDLVRIFRREKMKYYGVRDFAYDVIAEYEV